MNNTQTALIKKPESHLIPDDWKTRFLELYSNTGNKTFSAIHSGVTVRTVYNHIDSDPEFAIEVALAKQNAIMVLHEVAWERAVGTPIIDDATGDTIGHTPVSDKMIIFLLSSMSPDDYGHGAIRAEDRRSQIGSDGKAQIIINLPENHRGEITIDVNPHFPDASAILDAEFSEEDSSYESESVAEIPEHIDSKESTPME